MKKIIAAIDYSYASVNAAKYAASIALAYKANLVLLNVYRLPVNSSEMPSPILLLSIQENAEIMLNELKHELMLQTNNKIMISIRTDSGEFFEKLHSACNRIKPDLVILGSRSITDLQRTVFGGYTNNVIKHFEWPLYIVPVNNSYTSARKIGLSSDFENEMSLVLTDEFNFTVPGIRTPQRNSFNRFLKEEPVDGIVCQSIL
jgi:nucleotide-binding universal stress UspA family protein